MADKEPGAQRSPKGVDIKRILRRRKVVVGLGLLLSVVLVCFGAITLMLQRLEAKNASFQPPMTALERERLLPPEPTLEIIPSLDGLHYGNQDDATLKVDGYRTGEGRHGAGGVPLTQTLRLQIDQLQVQSSHLRHAAQAR